MEKTKQLQESLQLFIHVEAPYAFQVQFDTF